MGNPRAEARGVPGTAGDAVTTRRCGASPGLRARTPRAGWEQQCQKECREVGKQSGRLHITRHADGTKSNCDWQSCECRKSPSAFLHGALPDMDEGSLSKPRRKAGPAIRRVFHLYWRLSRGMTLGVRGLVFDGDGRVFL